MDSLLLARTLLLLSALIVLALGSLHLLFTFRGPRFNPRDPALKTRMQEVSPVLTSQTTMWKAWVGFNASHSLGAMLFGLVYGYLGLVQARMLFASPFLMGVGLALLVSFSLLGRAYWFSIPYRGVTLALGCFAAAWLTAWGR